MTDSSSDHHFGLAVSISIEALKALLIVNGGAATALIALTEKAPGKPDFGGAILSFGLAALLNAATLVFGYFSQLAYANYRLARESSKAEGADNEIRKHSIYQWVAIAILFASLITSGFGMFRAFWAI